ncbi:MAG TPA: hypothetical protein EYQ61_10460 [Dehalococcoidia bacterium]|nr:hypothetical protein [Dehalococcoidia bacterium]HIK88479.1 hypothetical protein [Dehalococcoidia bacterium]
MNPVLHPFRWLERKALYVPERSFRGTPDHVGLEYTDVFPVTADGAKLHGWHIPGSSGVVWLIFHGDSDRTVSYENAERIFSAATEPKQLEIIEWGDHDGLDLVDPDRYHFVLSEFLSRYDAL